MLSPRESEYLNGLVVKDCNWDGYSVYEQTTHEMALLGAIL